MSDLLDFINARLDEDERAARWVLRHRRAHSGNQGYRQDQKVPSFELALYRIMTVILYSMTSDPEQHPTPPADDVDETRSAIDRAARMAGFAITSFAVEHAGALRACTQADHDSLIVRVGLAYLVSLGLVTVAPPEAWEQFLPVDIPEPHRQDLVEALTDSNVRLAQINAALDRQ